MATFLYRLGRFSYRRRRTVIALWLTVLAAVGIGAATLSGPTADTFSIPGTESQQALDLVQQRFPEASVGGASARVVFAARPGETLNDPETATRIRAVLDGLKSAPQVSSVTDPFTTGGVNPAGTVAYAQVTYAVSGNGITPEARDALEDAADAGRANGLTIEMGGDAVEGAALEGASTLVGLAVAALVLMITFGSLVAAGLPLLVAVLGVAFGLGGITIATGFLELSSTTSTLALMLGLAVGIDYALFVISRYRHELSEGHAGEEAAGRAIGTAGSAVVFAGLTVVIALAALAVVGIPLITEMGLAAAGTVVVAVLIALSLLPALLGAAGKRIHGRVRRDGPREAGSRPARAAFGSRWARFVTRRPLPVLVVAVLALGLVAIPALDLRLGLPDDSSAAPGSTQRSAYELLSDGFGPGFNGPLTVVVDTAGVTDASTAAAEAGAAIAALDDVVAVSPAVVNAAGDAAILQVVPASGPSSVATQALVTAIRDQSHALRQSTGAELWVTGQTAINADITARMTQALPPYLAVVVLLSLILLMLVFRSVLVPVKAALGFLLSVAATFGALVAVFQWGWAADLFGLATTGPIVSLLPILTISVTFGLSMDYEVFLVTRMREEHVHGATPAQAVVDGFGHGARVVTAAALIMISVFSGFLLSDQALVKSLGFAFATAIALDAFVVRMTIVPAVMGLLGARAWWLPRWLERLLPDVDVEGEKLRRRIDASPGTSETAGAPGAPAMAH